MLVNLFALSIVGASTTEALMLYILAFLAAITAAHPTQKGGYIDSTYREMTASPIGVVPPGCVDMTTEPTK